MEKFDDEKSFKYSTSNNAYATALRPTACRLQSQYRPYVRTVLTTTNSDTAVGYENWVVRRHLFLLFPGTKK
eukprot:scaffold15918_cov57-Attheya_sp.AAC.2